LQPLSPEQGLSPTAICTGNGYEDEAATPIPTDLPTAISLARSSTFLKELCGDDLYELMLQQAEREVGFIDAQVTPLERERYLGNF